MTPDQILSGFRRNGLTIAVAESCTGGMLAAALTDPAGASDVFVAGFVTYSNAAKKEMLGVRAETLDAFGAVSEQVASEMAKGAAQRSGADVAVSITGIAGPGPSEHKPEGRVCFGLTTATGTITETVEFGPIGRSQVRLNSVQHALALLGRSLQDA